MRTDNIRAAISNRIVIALAASVATFSGTIYGVAEQSLSQYIVSVNRSSLEIVMRDIIDIALDAPRNTTHHGLSNATTDSMIISRVEDWVKNGNSARTGQLKTLCKYDQDGLEHMMMPSTALTICRLVD